MNSRERLKTIIAGEVPDRCGFWLGNPHPDSWPNLHGYFKTTTEEELRRKLNDDFRWIAPWEAYKHPEGKPIFDVQRAEKDLGAGGIFSECEDVGQVEEFAWPNPDYLDFSGILQELKKAGDVYRASGFWCPFFHDVAEFMGMENYFVKMYTHPEVVHAITGHVIDFYLEGNRRLFEQAGDMIDAFFFGNDFGSQFSLLLGREELRQFLFPYMSKLIRLAQEYNYQVIMHSCGSVYRIIPDLIEMGVQALHPLQAKAADMSAETLAREFKGQIAFIGGVDTQDLLVHGTPEEIKREVQRLKKLLGPSYIISPSHEAILPDIPPANIEAMAEAARDI
jgi:uroporphyrinogen decarboxylase